MQKIFNVNASEEGWWLDLLGQLWEVDVANHACNYADDWPHNGVANPVASEIHAAKHDHGEDEDGDLWVEEQDIQSAPNCTPCRIRTGHGGVSYLSLRHRCHSNRGKNRGFQPVHSCVNRTCTHKNQFPNQRCYDANKWSDEIEDYIDCANIFWSCRIFRQKLIQLLGVVGRIKISSTKWG